MKPNVFARTPGFPMRKGAVSFESLPDLAVFVLVAPGAYGHRSIFRKRLGNDRNAEWIYDRGEHRFPDGPVVFSPLDQCLRLWF